MIATVLGVAETTVRRDIKRKKLLQICDTMSQLQHLWLVFFWYGDQKVYLSMDGKYRIAKLVMTRRRCVISLEFAYLAKLKVKSLREIEELTHTPFRTVSNTLGLPDVGDFLHEQVTRLFVRVRRWKCWACRVVVLSRKTQDYCAWWSSAFDQSGWLIGRDNHRIFGGVVPEDLRLGFIACLDPVSVKAVGSVGRSRLVAIPLRMNDRERS